MVRRERFGEIALLVKRLSKKNARNSENIEINGIKTKATDKVIRQANGDVKIRRPATDDSWY